MDLDVQPVDVARVLGRATLPLVHSFVRELEQADLLRLSVEKGSTPPLVTRISDRHHALARSLANGDAPCEAAIKTGYSASRISILQNDPAFKELLVFYRDNKSLAEAQVMDRLGTLTLSAVALLEDRLENDTENVKTRELLDIAVAGLDRSGHGPSSKLQVTSLTLSAEDMAKLTAASKDPHVTVIEARQKDQRAGRGEASVQITLAESEAEGQQSQGDGIREGGGEGTPAENLFQRPALVYSEVRPVASVQGQVRDELCSAGSLSSVSSTDPVTGM